MSSGASGELADVAGDAMVIRFRPWDADRVWAWALKEHRRTGRYRLSVFADRRAGQETTQDVIDKLLQVSELADIDPEKNKKYCLCTAASELQQLGFTFWKDGEDGELDQHYSVDLGIEATREDVDRFLGVFGSPTERRQAWNA